MRPAVYKHCMYLAVGWDGIRSIPRRAHTERPGPRWPQPHLANGICGVGTQCTGPRTKINECSTARGGGAGESVQYERTERAAGGDRVCAALAITSRGFDSWLAHETRAEKSSEAAPRRHRRPPRRRCRLPPINTRTPTVFPARAGTQRHRRPPPRR